jgi:hypothetical protein
MSNWWFVVGTAAVILLMPRVAMMLVPHAYVPEEVLAAKRSETPLELVGIDRPFTPDDRVMLDNGLALDALPVPVPGLLTVAQDEVAAKTAVTAGAGAPGEDH